MTTGQKAAFTRSGGMTPQRLRHIIEELDTDQSKLARALGVPDRQVRRWIAGERAVPADKSRVLRILAGESIAEIIAEIVKEIETYTNNVRRTLEKEKR